MTCRCCHYSLWLLRSSDLLARIADAWAEDVSDSEFADLKAGGYMARNVTEQLTVISLNTVMYSVKVGWGLA